MSKRKRQSLLSQTPPSHFESAEERARYLARLLTTELGCPADEPAIQSILLGHFAELLASGGRGSGR